MQPIDSLTRTIIRDMRAEDRDPVIEILTGSDPWKRLGFTAVDWNRIFAPLPAGRDTFVLEIEGNVLGIAIVRRKFLFGDYLELLGISPSAVGRGLGSRLLTHVESLTFARANNMFACVSDFNEAPGPSTASRATRKSAPCRTFSFPATPRFCCARRPGRHERANG
jgi:ribosomal-protein-alanine N-acetyltransferase